MFSKIINYSQDHPFVSLGLCFIWIFLFQSLNIFWGFELVDSGYHLTAFDNIFDAPDSVSGNFPLYLTNLVGGIIMKLFPNIGIVGFRFLGAFFVDCSILLVFICLRKEIPVIHLLIGSILIVMNYIQIPYSFNNGICSCFFYVCALLALYRGLVSDKIMLVLLSGFFIGINIFSRIPNVLAIGLTFVTMFHSYIDSKILRYDWESSFFFLLGIIAGVGIILLIIISLGHQKTFIDALNGLLFIGKTSGDGHSFGNLIWTQIYFYLNAIMFASLFFAISFVYSRVGNILLRLLFISLASLVIFYHVYLNIGYEPLWSICAMGCCVCLVNGRVSPLLALFAVFMLLFEIMGSGGGNNHGSLPALLAAPVASYVLLNKKNIIFVIVACMALFMRVIKQGNYFDFGPLSSKKFFINTGECSLIRTTEERAEAINATLPALKKYIHPKDTLLVYDSAPMMNYLTHTRPAGGVCWPAVASYIKPFESAPKILIQRFNDFSEPAIQTYGIPTNNQMINAYMKEHQYHIVWENPYFILLFPQK